MNVAHFDHLSKHICQYLSQAKRKISIVVCWFSHRDIFEVLIERLQSGLEVSLILEYDSQNIRDDGLDFQRFIHFGGQFWAAVQTHLMHHKFALIDDRLLLSGSFNWTYNTNAENLIVSDDLVLVDAFKTEFNRQKTASRRIYHINRADLKVFHAFPLFEPSAFQLPELRRKIGAGANIWVFRLDKMQGMDSSWQQNNFLCFDAEGLLTPYWRAYRIWDEKLFADELTRIAQEHNQAVLRDLRRWTLRIKVGDLALVLTRKKAKKGENAPVLCQGLGIIQSTPMPYGEFGHSSCRAVQWIKIMENKSLSFTDAIKNKPLSRFRGSGLKLLQDVF